MDVQELEDLGPDRRAALFERGVGTDEVRAQVEEIVERVREEGDAVLREYSREFDGVEVGHLEISGDVAHAYNDLDDDLKTAIDRAADNVRQFHEDRLPEDWRRNYDGRHLGVRYRPIDRAGVYVPGGTADYPSSAIMGIVPATVAGVDDVVVVTPPAEDLPDATLAAIYSAGADEVYQVGGAQAVAALAYGTETIDPVQTIVGPGNRYVTAAKELVQPAVEVDFPAGPSEILVLADDTADPEFAAADMLAQAEHAPEATAVAVTEDRDLAESIADAVKHQVEERERADTIREALDHDASGVFVTRSTSEAIAFAEEYAPEHLSIQAEDDEGILRRIENAGSVCLGPYSPVAAGDYATGPNHVLPTGGAARLHGGLSVDEFLRATTIQRVTRDALADLSETVTTIAEAEGFEAHAESVRIRLDEDRN